MGFPISYDNEFILLKNEIGEDDIESLKRNILISLQKEKASYANIENGIIKFRGGMRFVNSWNILLPITYGEINIVDQHESFIVTIGLKFTQMLIIISIMMPIFVSTVRILEPSMSLKEIFIVLVLGWFWLFGGNYLSTVFRFPRFIKRQLKSKKINS